MTHNLWFVILLLAVLCIGAASFIIWPVRGLLRRRQAENLIKVATREDEPSYPMVPKEPEDRAYQHRDYQYLPGPPPHEGWWYTRTNISYFYTWRWWEDGKWSIGMVENANYMELEQVKHAKIPIGFVEWCFYWPKNARVPRINPETLEETS